jgi:hypothetical protein
MKYEIKFGTISETFKVGSIDSTFKYGIIDSSFKFFETPTLTWILTTGFWDDSAQWIDTELWNDGVVFSFSLDFSDSDNSQYIPLI